MGRDGKFWARTIEGAVMIAVAASEDFRNTRLESFKSAHGAVSCCGVIFI
jgi:hypothetical protein